VNVQENVVLPLVLKDVQFVAALQEKAHVVNLVGKVIPDSVWNVVQENVPLVLLKVVVKSVLVQNQFDVVHLVSKMRLDDVWKNVQENALSHLIETVVQFVDAEQVKKQWSLLRKLALVIQTQRIMISTDLELYVLKL